MATEIKYDIIILRSSMPRNIRSVDELTTDELRRLLIEKRRSERQSRLDQYRRTGRIISVEPAPTTPELTELQSQSLEEPAERHPARRRQRRKWMSSLLVGIEVIAVIGLVFILFTIASIIRNMNRVEASPASISTTPTALISAVILPSGHTSPDAPGGAQPNYAEIPENLRAPVQTMAELPIPTAGPESAQHLRIPRIGVDQDIVPGDNWEQLKKGIGQHAGSVNPGQNGNIILSAHNDIYGETFRYLDQLANGDEVYIRTNQREYTYVVDQIQIVDPNRVDLLSQTQEPILTLISCYPYKKDTQRIVVVAHLLETP
jgi:sortase A